MSSKYLINGGNASNANIYYWNTHRVTVDTDPVTVYYKIGDGGNMTQRCHLPVQGSFKVSGTYLRHSVEDEILFKITIVLDTGAVLTHFEILSEFVDKWAAFGFTMHIPQGSTASSIEFDISYSGSSVGKISTIAAVAAYSDVIKTCTFEEFLAKCITYGLDADKPDLTQIYEEVEE